MWKERILNLVVTTILVLSTVSIITIDKAKGTNGTTFYVGGSGPGNYTFIQSAIDDASDGDEVFVYDGVYYENVLIYKTINLAGEDKNTTVLDGDMYGNVINITSDRVNISGFTIRNSGNEYYDAGIKCHSNHNYIHNNTIMNNKGGILCWHSHNNLISRNNFVSNSPGIKLITSPNNTIMENNLSLNGVGIILWFFSDDNTISDNVITKNRGGGIIIVSFVGYDVYDPDEGGVRNIISGNTISNNSRDGINIDDQCDNNLITNNVISKNSWRGIDIGDSRSNTLINNIVKSNNWGGIRSWGNNIHISQNTITDNGKYGISIHEGSEHTIQHNLVSNNSVEGIKLYARAQHNIVFNNTVSNNNMGIHLYKHSNHNTVSNNNILKNIQGIYINHNSSNNTIVDNIIKSNYNYGLNARMSVSTNDNIIYHNNFINNNQNAEDNHTITMWDKGYPSGGNYWDDYVGVDANGDGIGDTPYNITGGSNQDNYPLMNYTLQYGVELSCSNMEKTVPPKGNATYRIIVTNTGNIVDTISIPLPLPCDCGWTDSLNTESVELLPNQNTTILLNVSTVWDFVPIDLWYWMTTIIATSQGDPTKSDTITVNTTIIEEPWDINRDGRTNILDLIIIGQHWGETGTPCWIPMDTNCDGMVNILDMMLVGQHWTG